MLYVKLALNDSDGNEVEIVRKAYINLPGRGQYANPLDEKTIDMVVADAVERLKAGAR